MSDRTFNGHYFDITAGKCLRCGEEFAVCQSFVCRVDEKTKPVDPPINFDRLQREVNAWSRKNFPERDPNNSFTGMVEELGELAHARLKARQGIRGTAEEHRDAEMDAIGDLSIYMADYCAEAGIDWQAVVTRTWAKVSKRDWTKNKVNGEAAST